MIYFFIIRLLFLETAVLALPLPETRRAEAADHNASDPDGRTSNLLFRRSPASGSNYPLKTSNSLSDWNGITDQASPPTDQTIPNYSQQISSELPPAWRENDLHAQPFSSPGSFSKLVGSWPEYYGQASHTRTHQTSPPPGQSPDQASYVTTGQTTAGFDHPSPSLFLPMVTPVGYAGSGHQYLQSGQSSSLGYSEVGDELTPKSSSPQAPYVTEPSSLGHPYDPPFNEDTMGNRRSASYSPHTWNVPVQAAHATNPSLGQPLRQSGNHDYNNGYADELPSRYAGAPTNIPITPDVYNSQYMQPQKDPSLPEQTFKCEVCSMTFQFYTNLCRHRYTHTDIRFVCDKCSALFTRKDALGRHKKNKRCPAQA